MMKNISPTIQYRKITQLLFTLAMTAMLSACQPSQTVESNVQFKAPAKILQVRAVDQTQLNPSVRLSNGQTIPMQKTGTNTWNGSIIVQPDTSYFVTVEWIETMPEGDLVLAMWAQDVEVGAEGKELELLEENYDLTLDLDGDGISNLNERRNNTNPFVHNDQNNGDGTGNGTGDDSANSATTTGMDTSGTGGSSIGNGTSGSVTTGTSTSSNVEGGTDGTVTAGNTGSEGTGTDGTSTSGSTDNGDGGSSDGQSTDGNTAGSIGGENTTSGTDGGSIETPSEATVLIPRISASSAPTIDGEDVNLNAQDNLTGEWKDAVQFDNTGERLWINNLMINNGTDADDGAELRRWAAVHDGEYLYVLVLSDDIGQRESDSVDHWQDDTLELFIDGDNSKLNTWGDDDDTHLLIPLQKLNSSNREGNNEINGRFSTGPGSPNAELDIEFFTGPGIGPDGIVAMRFEQDVYELAIPLDTAGITIGEPFGFELQIDDDDDGGSRDTKWGWFHPSRSGGVNTDRTYRDPSIMGTVVLEE